MRVKLQYSVELNEVPEIVAELIEDEASRLNHCGHMIQDVCDALRQEDSNIAFVLKKIDKVRQTLGTLDIRLGEMEGLLSGYDNAINPPASEQIPVPQTPTASPPSVSVSDKVNPDTGVYNYEPPYSAPEEPTE
jgi:hypothetical protein